MQVLATFRLQYEDDYEYVFSVLSTRFKFGGRKFSKRACSELKTRTHRRPRTAIGRSLFANGKRRFHSFIEFYVIHLKKTRGKNFIIVAL